MAKTRELLTRQTFLGGVLLLPALSGALSVAGRADASKASKAAMHYQTSPNGSMQCSGCKFFIPNSDPKTNGTCQIVDGDISPNGYCMAYTAKSS
ncbi:MAG: high-potential iron-sulfur protein [Candidatus Eremiobacteraeota bacterium]|nr:high-potential iron-sulfur protein [Candidatus Eremiobacteraeota bacterium]